MKRDAAELVDYFHHFSLFSRRCIYFTFQKSLEIFPSQLFPLKYPVNVFGQAILKFCYIVPPYVLMAPFCSLCHNSILLESLVVSSNYLRGHTGSVLLTMLYPCWQLQFLTQKK